jgi:putative ABC transport system substrate-binding protein
MERRSFIALISGAAGWPLAARAQHPAMPVIGYLSVGSPKTDNIPERMVAFRRGLNEAGFVEGQNYAIEYRGAEGQYDRLPAMAADLVRRQATVIVTPGTPPTAAAKAATSTIPIVFDLGIDPVQSGFIASLSRLGGNLTGVAVLTAELAGKRLDLLRELLPKAAVIALLSNPSNPITDTETRSLQDAARSLGLQTPLLQASTSSEIDAAFGTLGNFRSDGLVVSGDPLFTSQRAQIIELSARGAVPAIYIYREFVTAGGLMSYGTELADTYRQLALYTAKILNGANPAELPVQQAVKLDLVINLKTANALGLTVPLTLLGRADEVIE